MRLFGRLLMLSVWTPGPREWMCAQRAVPVKAATHISSLKSYLVWRPSGCPAFMSPVLSRGAHKRRSGTRWVSENRGHRTFFPQLAEQMFQDRRGCEASFIYEICVAMVKLVCGCFDRWLLRMKGGGTDCFSSAQPTESLWNENHLYPGSAFLSSFLLLSPRMQIGCKCWTGVGK